MKMSNRLPARQIHLDFHTSPLIPDVGEAFDKEAFGKRLKDAKVNSINLFAKCHHGLCYYPTKIGRRHPAVKFDLLGDMIEACHENDIKAPIYFTTGWEEVAAENLNWVQLPFESNVIGEKTRFQSSHYSWRNLCHNKKDYVAQIMGQVDELLEAYEVDGFWFDIVTQTTCVCDDCVKSMAELGFDPQNIEDVKKHDFIVIKNFLEKIYTYIKSKRPEALIYFNMSLSPDNGDEEAYSIRHKLQYQTQYEIESLPSGEWGYNHFPLYVNYLDALGDKEVIGMNGKFHKSWGDFGTLKNIEALEYECFRMVASGAKCCIGDQLHPRGELDDTVYKRIGHVYGMIEEREEWLYPSKRVSDIGVFLCHSPLEASHLSDEGAMRMMLELQHTFDFIDRKFDFSPYKLIILPDDIRLDQELSGKFKEYIKNGGKIIATGKSGLTPDGTTFALKEFGVCQPEENPYAPYYIKIEDEMRGNADQWEYTHYEQGMKVTAIDNTEVLGHIGVPYFNREYNHYCSHCQTPFDKMTKWPAITRCGNVMYMAHPYFKDYIVNGMKLYRDIIGKGIELLLAEPLVKSDLPATVEMTVREQDNRVMIHLIHYIPERKCKSFDIIDTKIPLYNKSVSLRRSQKPSKVYSAPSYKHLDFSYDNGYVHIEVPEIDGYEIVVVENE